MQRYLRSLVVVVVLLIGFWGFGASEAQAHVKTVWTVSGVVANGVVGTLFACSNNSGNAATVVLSVFDASGAQVSTSGNFALGAGESVLFGTTDFANFVETIVPTGGVQVGYATIASDVRSKFNCSAFLVNGTGLGPLTVAKKDKQKGD